MHQKMLYLINLYLSVHPLSISKIKTFTKPPISASYRHGRRILCPPKKTAHGLQQCLPVDINGHHM